MRRILSFILTLVLCCNMLINTLAAESTGNFVWITVMQNETESNIKVIRMDKPDFLFSGEDLAALSGFKYEINGNNAIFQRGSKKIIIDIKYNTLQYSSNKYDVQSLIEKVQYLNGMVYYSGSELLPWLNVNCEVEDGKLKVIPDFTSIWDLGGIEGLYNLEFDFNTVCKNIGVNSKWLKSRAYIQSKGLKIFWDIIPISFNSTLGSYQDYYDIFDDMFKAKERKWFYLQEYLEKNSAESELINMCVNLYGSSEFQPFTQISDFFAVANMALDGILFYKTYYEDNKINLQIVDNLHSYIYAYGGSEAIYMAAGDVSMHYRDIFKGFNDRTVHQILDFCMDKALSKTIGQISSLLVINKFIKPSWADNVNRISKYEVLQDYALDIYAKSSEQSVIRDMLSGAMLYLYSTEQSWIAMQDYCKGKDKKKFEAEFEEKAKHCSELYIKYLDSVNSATNDSDSMKKEYSQKLLEMFLQINISTENVDDSYAIKLESLSNMSGRIEECNDELWKAYKIILDHPAKIYNVEDELIDENIFELRVESEWYGLSNYADNEVTLSGIAYIGSASDYTIDIDVIMDGKVEFPDLYGRYRQSLQNDNLFNTVIIGYDKENQKSFIWIYSFLALGAKSRTEELKCLFDYSLSKSDYELEGDTNYSKEYFILQVNDENSLEIQNLDWGECQGLYQRVTQKEEPLEEEPLEEEPLEESDNYCKNIYEKYGNNAIVFAEGAKDCGDYYEMNADIYDFYPEGLEEAPCHNNLIRISKEVIIIYQFFDSEGNSGEKNLSINEYANGKPFESARMWNIVQDEHGYITSFWDTEAG